jgi:hypothetical protein
MFNQEIVEAIRRLGWQKVVDLLHPTMVKENRHED